MGDNYFKNKKVVIIGASGNLGQAYTQAFFQVGAHLFLLGRNMDKLASFSEDIASNIPICSVDITNETSIRVAVSEVQKWSDNIDIVINATGFDVRKSLLSHSEEEINQTMTINLIGAILVSKHFLPLLKNQKGATIVHSGGFADGRLAFPYYSVDVAFFFYRINESRIKTGEEKDASNLFLPQCNRYTIRKALSSSLERDGDLYIKYKSSNPSFT